MFSLRRFHSVLVAPLLLPLFLVLNAGESDNHPPIAVDDQARIHGSGQIPVTANDSDPDNEVFFVSAFPVPPSHGTIANVALGTIFYVANSGFVGSDSFTYRICDGQQACATAVVSISVENNAPVGQPDSFNIHGNTVISGFLTNDSDPDKDGITCGDNEHPCIEAFPQHGGLENVGTDRWFYFVEFGYTGVDTLTYNVCDDLALCTPTTVTLSVNNQAPTAVDDSYSVPNKATTIGPFMVNDSDPDGDFIPRLDLVTLPQHGTLAGSFTIDRKFYRPATGFNGEDNFTYKICDDLGACSTTATVRLQVGAQPTPTPTPTPPPPSPTPTPTPPEPLIFIPGIGGSQLDEPGGNLWLGTALTDRSRLRLNNPPVDFQGKPIQIVATDAIRKTTIGRSDVEVYQHLIDALKQKGGYVEYQVNNIPARRTQAGCDLNQKPNNPNLFVFAYDWRQSNVATASALRDYVGCVQQFYPERQVNILTHSMGGIVARRYLLDNPQTHHVNKLITIAAPWLGAPKALYILETGNFFNISLADRFFAPLFKSLVEFFPSVHQILPSRTYYALAGSFFGERAGKRTWDVNSSGLAEENYQPDDVAKLLDTIQFKNSTPAKTGNEFHDNPGQDDWHNDSSGIQYYHIYGVQYWNKTPGKVLAEKHLQFDLQGNTVEKNRYDFTLVPGDGTVPSISATRAPNLNAPNAILKNFGPSFLGPDDASNEHTALTQNDRVIDYVLSCLTNNQSAKLLKIGPKPFRRFERTHHLRKANAPQDENPVFGHIYDVKLDGVTLPTIRDAFGNDTSQIAGVPFGNMIPNVSSYVSGEDSYQLLFPADIPLGQSYTVSFASTGQPLTIDFDKSQGDSDTATQLVRYLDINVPAGTSLQLTFGSSGPENLASDQDGDGVFETIIDPTTDVTGDAARDRVEPVISFTEMKENGQHLVQLQASDPSGVKMIRYSLDGHTFQMYEHPIVLNTCANRTVYAVADDSSGNRSGVVEYEVTNEPPDISSARASLETLWPPNHKMVQIQILGVLDKDCDLFSTVITAVTQDEPVDGSGDGNTCPDAQVNGTSTALLRAERNGAGNGRVYTVYFTTTDAKGSHSSGSVKVRIAKNANALAVEDQTTFDSTRCP